jgi:hypothetical protein
MPRCTHTLYSVLASAGRTMEEFGLTRIARPRMTLIMRQGELAPMLRTAHECAIFDHGLIPSPDRSTRIDGAESPPPRKCGRAHGESAVANPTIAVPPRRGTYGTSAAFG